MNAKVAYFRKQERYQFIQAFPKGGHGTLGQNHDTLAANHVTLGPYHGTLGEFIPFELLATIDGSEGGPERF